MSTKVFKYILNFQADAQKFGKEIGGVQGMLKGAAVAAGALFAADKIMDAAKAVADYALEISSVNNQVQQLTGLSGAQADVMTGGAQAIAQAYGQDVGEAVKTANVLMRNFGETSQGSFDILNAGLSGAANANGDFLQQVSEYSTHFREAGASATDMFAVIQQGSKMGVFDDKAADAIKEGSIRLREMTNSTRDALNAIGLSATQIENDIKSGSKSMFDVMRDVSAQLSTLPEQGAATGAALADIFGGPGEDAVEFIRSLHEIDTSAQAIADSLTENQKAQMAWTEELQEFHTVGAQVFGGTGTLVTKVKTLFMGFVNDAIKGAVSVINYFIDLYNESMVFRAGIEYIKATVGSVFDALSMVFKNFWDTLKTTGRLIKAVFTGNFSEIPKILKEKFNSAVANGKEFGESVANRFSEGIENVLNPRKKIELISLSTEAEAAGVADGLNYAKGFASAAGSAGSTRSMASMPEMSSIGGGVESEDMEFNITPKLNLEQMQEQMPLFQANMEAMAQAEQEQMEMASLMSDSLAEGFNLIGQSVVDSLGLAETGFQGFLGSLLQSTVQVISMLLAQAIANAIVSGTETGSASGPLAAISTPAFIALAVGSVLAAFAQVPAFADGGIVYGPTLGLMGEYPGASSDPEVISPLSKLKGMLGQQGRDRILTTRTALKRDELVIWLEEGQTELAKMGS